MLTELADDPIEESEVEVIMPRKRKWNCSKCKEKEEQLNDKNRLVNLLQTRLIEALKNNPDYAQVEKMIEENTAKQTEINSLREEVVFLKKKVDQFEKQNRINHLKEQIAQLQEELNNLE